MFCLFVFLCFLGNIIVVVGAGGVGVFSV